MENQFPNPNENLWRGPLTKVERAKLSAAAELEARLTGSLAQIPDAPLASNFTARVLAAVELDETRSARRPVFRWDWRSLLPRVAVAATVLVLAGFTFKQYQIHSQRTLLAKNVAQVTVGQPLPSVDSLKDFDAIQRMSQPAHADNELLALLQ